MKKKQLDRIEMKLNALLRLNEMEAVVVAINDTIGGSLPPDDDENG
mgnify:CR=1 FL=1